MMGIEAEKMIFVYQKFLLTRLKSRRPAGKPIIPIFHFSIFPFFQAACRMAGRLRNGANLYIFLKFCQ
jgi:hypothetical protein